VGTAHDYAANVLRECGVVLHLDVSVRETTAHDVLLSDGTRVKANLVVRAGGLRARRPRRRYARSRAFLFSLPFEHVDRGIMAMVGRNAAVAELGDGRRPITGFVGFAAWLAVHALLMTTFCPWSAAVLQWVFEYCGELHVNAILDRSSAPQSKVR
jgi:NADH dehydrogenase FAD-containing subunit